MLRTVFTIGIFAVLGVLALRLVFGVLGPLMLIFLWLLKWALLLAVAGFLVYLAMRLVSPDTARRIRERWSGSTH